MPREVNLQFWAPSEKLPEHATRVVALTLGGYRTGVFYGKRMGPYFNLSGPYYDVEDIIEWAYLPDTTKREPSDK